MEYVQVLAINPGSTSTKIAVYEQTKPAFLKTIRHSVEELKPFKKITDQYEFRKQKIADELNEAGIREEDVKAVVGRGGLVKPIESGVYKINDKMIADLKNSPLGEHASNLGGLIAIDFAKYLGHETAYIVDPIVVDELQPLARIAGHPKFERRSIFHALNQKAVARDHANSLMKKYEDLNLIIVHLGGGITIGAHNKGKVIDVNQGLDGEGPFTPERSGTLPTGALARLCFSGDYTYEQIKRMIKGEGGLVAYLGTNSAFEVEKRIKDKDEEARMIYEAMAYQISKAIGAMATVLYGDVDGILITGGMAHSTFFVNMITERVHKIAPVHVYPGGDEMRALAMNALRVLNGEIEAKEYE